MALEGGPIRYRNNNQCDSQVFEMVDGVKVYEHLTSIPSLLASAVKLSRLRGANFNRGCGNYLNYICILAPTSPFGFDNDNVSEGFLFFGQGKQLMYFGL